MVGVFDMAPFLHGDAIRVPPYAACCSISFLILPLPAHAGRLLSGDEEHGSRQRHGYQITPQLSLSCPMRAEKQTHSVQKLPPPRVKQAAYGGTRTANIKKKLMKNKVQFEAAAPANAGQPSSITNRPLPKINFARRYVNRSLTTESLIALLRREAPHCFALAEVVGKWVWIQFAEIPAADIRQQLAELGFHWNNTRQAWQHPCGSIAAERADYDPRKRYGSYFAAQRQTA